MRILLIGHGRMGQLLERHAAEHGCEVAGIAEVDRPFAEALRQAGRVDVAIDFSHAAAVAENVRVAAEHGVSLVIGTTGWQGEEADLRRTAAAARIGVLASANFSIGMNAFALVVETAARAFAAQNVGAFIHEAHHSAKKDAPSGSALMLLSRMREAGYDRPIDVSSTRAGTIVGTHTVGFDAPAEIVTLTHDVKDRAVFAHGALDAAKWLPGRQGWFTMRDLLMDPSPGTRT